MGCHPSSQTHELHHDKIGSLVEQKKDLTVKISSNEVNRKISTNTNKSADSMSSDMSGNIFLS